MPPPRLSAEPLGSAVIGWLHEFAQQGIVVTDEHLIIRGWNRWLEVNTGYSSASVVGRPLLEAFPDLSVRGFEPYYRAALRGEIKVLAHAFHQYVFAPAGGGATDVRQSGRIEPLFSGTVAIGTVTVLENVSERIATERELRNQIEASERARAVAEEAVRIKDDFLATLSHEMRTPLNAVIGWTQILRSQGIDANRMSRALEVIERNAKAQARLIDDMLDTARIMSGKLRLDLKPLDLARVALAALDVVSMTAAAKGVTIVPDMEQNVMPVLGDPDRLQQIVWNLLTNAIKFSPAGGRITVSLVEEASVLKLSVSDSGEGISPEFLPHVFERFQQADPASNRRNAGLGLGLSLVRQLAELHGGEVTVTSTRGAGSTFTVSFPAHKDVSHRAGVGAANQPPLVEAAVLASVRVLVVAENDDERDMISTALEQHGATVAGLPYLNEAAIGITAPDRPDVIVYSLPNTKRAADLHRTSQTMPAIRSSGIAALAITPEDPAEKAGMMALGFQAHLSRPLSPAALVSTVLGLARLR